MPKTSKNAEPATHLTPEQHAQLLKLLRKAYSECDTRECVFKRLYAYTREYGLGFSGCCWACFLAGVVDTVYFIGGLVGGVLEELGLPVESDDSDGGGDVLFT